MSKKEKPLKLWNGRPYGVLPGAYWRYNGQMPYVYVAAYSVADARRLCLELGLLDPGTNEVTKYWNSGSWGNSMDGVTPERGVWIRWDDRVRAGSVPQRILSAADLPPLQKERDE